MTTNQPVCLPAGLFANFYTVHTLCLQECTFAPKTGRPPNRQRLAAGLPVEDRLQLGLAGRAQALERARGEQEREQLADCTFAPQVGRLFAVLEKATPCVWVGAG